MIENVIFDVGNVLMGYDWEEYLRRATTSRKKNIKKSQMQHFETQSGRNRTEHTMRSPGM